MGYDEDDLDFPCLNEQKGLECDYPMCDCEIEYMYQDIEELPDTFERLKEEGIDDDSFFDGFH